MKKSVWNIIVNAPGSPHEIIAGPFNSKIAAEQYANETEDADGETIADWIQSGMYRYALESAGDADA